MHCESKHSGQLSTRTMDVVASHHAHLHMEDIEMVAGIAGSINIIRGTSGTLGTAHRGWTGPPWPACCSAGCARSCPAPSLVSQHRYCKRRDCAAVQGRRCADTACRCCAESCLEATSRLRAECHSSHKCAHTRRAHGRDEVQDVACGSDIPCDMRRSSRDMLRIRAKSASG